MPRFQESEYSPLCMNFEIDVVNSEPLSQYRLCREKVNFVISVTIEGNWIERNRNLC